MAVLVKTVNGLAYASVKTRLGLAVASIKTMNGLDTTAAGGDTAFITGQTLGTLRNDFTGGVGFQITTGGADIVVTQLGRWVVSGNSQTHTLRIRNGAGTDLANVTVNTSGAPTGAYLYGTLASSYTLLGGSNVYYILSDETSGGDQWYDTDTIMTTTAVGTMTASGGWNGSSIFTGTSTDNRSYVPTSFKYSSP